MKSLFISLIILIGAVHPLMAAQPPKIVLATNTAEDFPYLIGDSHHFHESAPGVAVELVQMVCEKLGLDLELRRFPWKRCLEIELKTGRADGVFFGSYKKDREKYGVYPMKNGEPDVDRRGGSATWSFYKRKGSDLSWDGQKLYHLKGSIGVGRGFSIIGELKKMNYPYDETNTPLSSFKKLVLNRVGAVVSLEDNAGYILSTYSDLGEQIEKLTPPVVTKPYFLILSHQFVEAYPEFAQKIWDTLRDVREIHWTPLVNRYLGSVENDHP